MNGSVCVGRDSAVFYFAWIERAFISAHNLTGCYWQSSLLAVCCNGADVLRYGNNWFVLELYCS